MLFNSVTVAIFFIELISSFQQQIAAQDFYNNLKNNLQQTRDSLNKEYNDLYGDVKSKFQLANNAIKEGLNKVTTTFNDFNQTIHKELEMCDSSDCNNQGTCIGNKQTYFCVCRLGYTGTKCETTLCDSDRDCNQKGICSGTSADFKCLCNIGFTGDKCEIPLHVKS